MKFLSLAKKINFCKGLKSKPGTEETIDIIISYLTPEQLESLSVINIKTGKKITFREQMISFNRNYYPILKKPNNDMNLAIKSCVDNMFATFGDINSKNAIDCMEYFRNNLFK